MPASDLARFRRLCGQFRWLAVFMVCSVGAILVLTYIIAPAVTAARGTHPVDTGQIDLLERAIWASPRPNT